MGRQKKDFGLLFRPSRKYLGDKMSAKLCSQQELCRHYTDSSKRKVHHIRITNPCKHWLALDCEKMLILAELQEFTTGEIMACEIAKINRIKKLK